MENSLRDLLDQLEWTNFSRVSTKDSVEKFEQVQFCTVSFNFRFTTLIELKKEGITSENSLFKHDWKKFEFPSIGRNYNFYEQRMENSLRYFLEWTIWMDRFLQSFAQLRILWKNSMSILFIQRSLLVSSHRAKKRRNKEWNSLFKYTHIYISQDFNDALIKKRNNTNTKLAPPFSSFPKEEPSPEVERSWKIPSRKF